MKLTKIQILREKLIDLGCELIYKLGNGKLEYRVLFAETSEVFCTYRSGYIRRTLYDFSTIPHTEKKSVINKEIKTRIAGYYMTSYVIRQIQLLETEEKRLKFLLKYLERKKKKLYAY